MLLENRPRETLHSTVIPSGMHYIHDNMIIAQGTYFIFNALLHQCASSLVIIA